MRVRGGRGVRGGGGTGGWCGGGGGGCANSFLFTELHAKGFAWRERETCTMIGDTLARSLGGLLFVTELFG